MLSDNTLNSILLFSIILFSFPLKINKDCVCIKCCKAEFLWFRSHRLNTKQNNNKFIFCFLPKKKKRTLREITSHYRPCSLLPPLQNRYRLIEIIESNNNNHNNKNTLGTHKHTHQRE